MPTKAVQQFMLGTVLSNENEARRTLVAMKAAGYDGIELCGFMIHPIGFMVRLLTKAAGMPVGKGGNLDWHKLVKDADLQVVSLHTDLGSLERDAKAVAEAIGTKLDRGATFLNGEGSYSHEPTKVVLAAVKKQQVTELKELVMAIDPNAFVIVQEAHQVLGDGFSHYSKQSL